jgi:hypothetical protein
VFEKIPAINLVRAMASGASVHRLPITDSSFSTVSNSLGKWHGAVDRIDFGADCFSTARQVALKFAQENVRNVG